MYVAALPRDVEKKFKFAANKEKNANKMHDFYMHPFSVTCLLTFLLLQSLIPIKHSLKKAYCFTQTGRKVNSALHTGHVTLYRFSTRHHLPHRTRSVLSVAIEQPRPHSIVYCKIWGII